MVTLAGDQARDEAARFVARMDADGWTEADESELQAWLAEDPLRQGLLLQVQAQWLALTPEVEAPAVPVEEEEPAPSGWGRRGVLAGLAASAALAFVGLRWSQSPAAYTTKLGEIRRLPLPDGSVMTMNSGSELTVSMATKLREVQLAQGEAWFEVAKDAQRPFVVAAGNVRVRAVGTAFSVRRRETGVEILVTEGIVETWADGDQSLRMKLEAGDRAMLSAHAVIDYETGISSSVDRALAWRGGMIDLNGRTLYDAADEFNRYNQRQIIIADPRVAREEFDGLFRVNDPEGFAEAVKASLGVSLDTSNPNLIRIE
ncbi:FecR domain-containing protein [Novosphingobium resinovorum]|uniref:Anti-FecI sigma factor FecR n=1 Tax=Novosphingobium resinovorum TaxID=158500 RepID=A0A031J526_9SPHN|nr:MULTISPECIES: FecR domain-containing protein [Novosphingobium]AOR79129.1 iron dicitrate transport regulator FecR [Novosphingobium resinovorum]EZP68944.1 Anti-FecI sigma factor FecR [Novosphingobium resinovorum]MBF7014692.1 FecR domain-containing protein [Novosphingobium sp. HR1a]WJM24826.1 FecR domain-containing protein [Novosphingobium resinovorum]